MFEYSNIYFIFAYQFIYTFEYEKKHRLEKRKR